MGILNLIASIGAIAAGSVADKFGRKRTIFTASLLFLVGTLLMTISQSFSMLLFGRIVTGIAIGFGLVIAPLYSAEIAPAMYRGYLVSIAEISINVGILMGYIANALFQNLPISYCWRWMLGMGLIPPVFIQLTLSYIPETPRWLCANGEQELAFEVLKQIYPNANAMASQVHQEIQEAIRKDQEENRSSWKDLFCPTPVLRSMLIVGLGVQAFQQLIGIEAVVYYSPEILASAGISNHAHRIYATVFIGLIKVSFIFVATMILDKVGRKPLLLASSIGISSALICLVFASNGGGISSSVGLSVFALCLFNASFSIGFGPIAWVLCSEVYPSPIRGRAMSLSTFVNRIFSGTCAMTFLSLTETLTAPGTFLMFAVLSTLAFIWVWVFVPETKNKTLEQIEHEFKVRNTHFEFGDPAKVELQTLK